MPIRAFSVEVAAAAQAKSGLKTIELTVDGVSYTIMIMDDLHHIVPTAELKD